MSTNTDIVEPTRPAPAEGHAPATHLVLEERLLDLSQEQGGGHEVIIEPRGRWPGPDVRALWAYRGLFFFLVWKNVKVRYAQTVMGLSWAVIQPVMTMIVFTAVFGNFARIPSDGVPYPVFSLAALVPWTYFAHSLNTSTASLTANKSLITKVYFPRLILPYTPVVSGMVDLAIAFSILLAMMLWYGIVPPFASLVVIPLLVLIAAFTAAGVGCWLSAINIQYRDVKQVSQFMVQIWMYATPVVYPLSMVPEHVRPFYVLNPLVGVIEGFRTVLLGTGAATWPLLATSATGAVLLFLTGTLFFRHTERIFADVA